MFRGRTRGLSFEPKDGMAVLVRGQIGVYEQSGSYQMYVDEMQPYGVGALAAAFEELKRRLAAEGLFDESRKRPLPALPRVVGIATSPTGAAIRDMISVSLRRFPGARLLLRPCVVQGPDAPPQVAAAIAELAAEPDVDIIIAGRGGGSLEELWAFNTEEVARAIFASPVPVISAVGHETDFTIADFVADVRAATPSAAAELAWPDRAELLLQLDGLRLRLRLALTRQLERDRQRLERVRASQVFQRPLDGINQARLRLDEVTRQLQAAGHQTVHNRRLQQAALTAALEALSPLGVLGRGYSVTRRWPAGAVLRGWQEAAPGDLIEVRLQDGELVCAVQHSGPIERSAAANE
jgi:exodeoxyribonuclease VII large subunit